MDDEVRLHDPLPETTIRAVRQLYAPPVGADYWASLETRVMARVREAAGTRSSSAMWHVSDAHDAAVRHVPGWARAGLVAAAAVLAVAAALLLRTHASDLREQYRALTAPGAAQRAADSLIVPSGALGAREDSDGATLRDVISK